MRFFLPILLCCASLALPTVAAAQPPALQVRLVDQAGSGVSGVTIALRDAGGAAELGAQITDARGEATFATLPTTTVRLAVSGTTISGAVIQLGESSFVDTPAILVRTDIGGPLVPLVLTPDGRVYLNPAVIEPEGGPAVAPAALAPTAPHAGAVTPGAPARATPAPLPRWALALICLALSGIALALTLGWRGRS